MFIPQQLKGFLQLNLKYSGTMQSASDEIYNSWRSPCQMCGQMSVLVIWMFVTVNTMPK